MTNSATPQHPGLYVKEKVIPSGVTVSKASKLMGIGRPALSNFLNGKASLSQSMALRLKKAFGANKEDLINMQRAFDAFNQKETEKKLAVKSYTPSFLKITAAQIEAWSEKIGTRELLAALIRRLILTTGKELSACNFPAHDLSQTQGWDGLLHSNNTTPWIPYGDSGWEFGCNKNPKTKANSDYKARLIANETERKRKTFVFVTPRIWKEKEDWVKNKRADNEWLNVVAYDANDLEQWLETSVPAQVWLSWQLGLSTEGCQTMEEFWRYWSSTTEPNMSDKIFDSSVADFSKRLIDWSKSPPNKPLVVAATSREEAMAFLYCISSKNADATTLLENGMFVSRYETTKRLVEISNDFIPITWTDEAERALASLPPQRHCIVITDRTVKGIEPDIVVDLPSFESFREALRDMGFDDAQMDVYSNESGNSPTILRRQLARLPSFRKPSWATNTDKLRAMIPIVFAGAWCTSHAADKEILELLADKKYIEIEELVAELSSLGHL